MRHIAAMQDVLIAGDTLDFPTTVAAYPASSGWALKYRLTPFASTSTAIELTSTADGDDYRTTVEASVTAQWTPGSYGYAAWVERGTESYVVDSGTCTISPDPRTSAAGTDTRSHARIVLEAIEAVIERRATIDQEQYSIGGRELKRTPIPQLIALRDRYASIVRSELAAARLSSGLPSKNKLFVRF